ncbi:MAG: hypothetical protein UX57_C0013G0001, partial [Candidatus Uhrbacteria bacterium GW2011_GWE2_46_68]
VKSIISCRRVSKCARYCSGKESRTLETESMMASPKISEVRWTSASAEAADGKDSEVGRKRDILYKSVGYS